MRSTNQTRMVALQWAIRACLSVIVCLALVQCAKDAPKAQPSPDAQPKTEAKALADAPPKDRCRVCREKHCSNYQGLFNLVDACFDHADAAFVKECTAAVACAQKNKCGYKTLGAAECFCGTADIGPCLQPGVANGPCQDEWYAAARSKALNDLSIRFSDVTFPAGVATFLLECDRVNCPECVP